MGMDTNKRDKMNIPEEIKKLQEEQEAIWLKIHSLVFEAQKKITPLELIDLYLKTGYIVPPKLDPPILLFAKCCGGVNWIHAFDEIKKKGVDVCNDCGEITTLHADITECKIVVK